MSETLIESGPVETPAKKTRGRPRKVTTPASGRIKVEVDDFIAPTEEKPKRNYWVGTTADCPFQNYTVAGTTFPRFTGNVHMNVDGEPSGRPEPGIKVPLDEDQVERVRNGVANRVFRFLGKDGRAVSLSRSGTYERPYKPMPNDEPAGRYLYMYDVSQGFPTCYHDGQPEPMID